MTRKEEKELTRRMLKVEDPVEMKTEPGTEVLVGTTPKEDAEELAARGKEGHHDHPDLHHPPSLARVAHSKDFRRRGLTPRNRESVYLGISATRAHSGITHAVMPPQGVSNWTPVQPSCSSRRNQSWSSVVSPT